MFVSEFDWSGFWQQIATWLSTSGLKLVIGLIGLFILFKLINLLAKGIRKRMIKKKVEKTICKATYGIVRNALKVVVFLVFLGFVGIETAGIGSLIASAGIAVGLALQGSLSNLAGGIIILLMHPFRIGDYIAAQGNEGTVEDIHMFYTSIVTIDNKVVSLPNGALSNNSIVNYSQKEYRRVDMKFNIGYESDLKAAEEAVYEALEQIPTVLTMSVGAPANPFVKLTGHGENALELSAKVWVKSSDYWDVFFGMQSGVFENFKKLGIRIPYPQVDVHCDTVNRSEREAPARLTAKELDAKRSARRKRYAEEEEEAKELRELREKEELKSVTETIKETFVHKKFKKSKCADSPDSEQELSAAKKNKGKKRAKDNRIEQGKPEAERAENGNPEAERAKVEHAENGNPEEAQTKVERAENGNT